MIEGIVGVVLGTIADAFISALAEKVTDELRTKVKQGEQKKASRCL